VSEYPPYVNGYGGIPKLFSAIIKAQTPTKFTHDFLNSVLGLKSSSFRAMIPFLKRLGFIDQGNNPTDFYKNYRNKAFSKTVMATRIKESYSTLYAANEYIHKLEPAELNDVIKTVTGFGDESKTLAAITGSFEELCKLADFEAKQPKEEESKPKEIEKLQSKPLGTKLGISYTINLNLPPTKDIEVFNAIFKSLKEHILHD